MNYNGEQRNEMVNVYIIRFLLIQVKAYGSFCVFVTFLGPVCLTYNKFFCVVFVTFGSCTSAVDCLERVILGDVKLLSLTYSCANLVMLRSFLFRCLIFFLSAVCL